jgi:PHD/YefM family antitoxin component YafN of YafNO toxin-antitoxin module
MLTITQSQAKDALDEYLDQARQEPVAIKDTDGGGGVVMLDSAEYDRLRAMDEAYWRMKSAVTGPGGLVGGSRPSALVQKR